MIQQIRRIKRKLLAHLKESKATIEILQPPIIPIYKVHPNKEKHKSDQIFAKSKLLITKNRKLVEIWMFDQKRKFWPKIEIVAKNPKFGQKSTLWLKKSKFSPIIQILANYPNFAQTCKFSKFCAKIYILTRNPNFAQKSLFCSIFQILY